MVERRSPRLPLRIFFTKSKLRKAVVEFAKGEARTTAFNCCYSMKYSIHHTIWMIAGCILPFLILFLLPAFGLNGNISIAAFLVLMIGCHLMHAAIAKDGRSNQHRIEKGKNEER